MLHTIEEIDDDTNIDTLSKTNEYASTQRPAD